MMMCGVMTASNSDMDLNPLIRVNLSTTRTWNDNSFPAGDPRNGIPIDELPEEVRIDAAYVHKQLAEIVKNEDLSRYIL